MIEIKETGIQPEEYTELSEVRLIIIHHNCLGIEKEDPSAVEVDEFAKEKGLRGIPYHFVIREDGSVERGLPENVVGMHAHPINDSNSLGILINGLFDNKFPNAAQQHSFMVLVKELCNKYGLACDFNYVIGHTNVNETTCPGTALYSILTPLLFNANSGRTGSYISWEPVDPDIMEKDSIDSAEDTVSSDSDSTVSDTSSIPVSDEVTISSGDDTITILSGNDTIKSEDYVDSSTSTVTITSGEDTIGSEDTVNNATVEPD